MMMWKHLGSGKKCIVVLADAVNKHIHIVLPFFEEDMHMHMHLYLYK